MNAPELEEKGPDPHVIDIEEATLANTNVHITLWTGPPAPDDGDEHRAG